MNTSLDDISAVIGFSSTLKLVAWFGDGISNLYVPAAAEEGQLLVKIIGLPAARAMSREWPKKHLNVPRMQNYDVELRKRHIARMIERGYSLREIAGQLQMSERRVSQIKEELRSRGLLVGGEAAQPPAVAPAPAPEPAVASPNVVPMPPRQRLSLGQRKRN